MAQYRVEFSNSAAKEFRSLPRVMKSRLTKSIDELGENPRPHGVRKLKGAADLYRIRVGQYRIVYIIDDKLQLVRITRVRHRRDVYR